MSTGAKRTLAGSIVATIITIVGVHYSQKIESAVSRPSFFFLLLLLLSTRIEIGSFPRDELGTRATKIRGSHLTARLSLKAWGGDRLADESRREGRR